MKLLEMSPSGAFSPSRLHLFCSTPRSRISPRGYHTKKSDSGWSSVSDPLFTDSVSLQVGLYFLSIGFHLEVGTECWADRMDERESQYISNFIGKLWWRPPYPNGIHQLAFHCWMFWKTQPTRGKTAPYLHIRYILLLHHAIYPVWQDAIYFD